VRAQLLAIVADGWFQNINVANWRFLTFELLGVLMFLKRGPKSCSKMFLLIELELLLMHLRSFLVIYVTQQ